MSEEMLIRHCSPTLAGMKTGSIFICDFESAAEMRESLRKWNKIFAKKGLRAFPLRCRCNRFLIYVYRPSHLSRDLCDITARDLLFERGYDPDMPEKCIRRLICRLDESEDFPHEIGLFLGYPPSDVLGFIENRVCKCSGIWKVYSDEESAKKTFKKYKKCTDIYSACLAKGSSVERLMVGKN